MTRPALDLAVGEAAAALSERGVPAPSVLFFLGTGTGVLPARLARALRVPLFEIEGVPLGWRAGEIHAGELAGLPLWLVADAPGSSELGNRSVENEPGWVGAFPVWLAAFLGASVCVHTSAGHALRSSGDPEPGTLVALSDHLNLSGRSPLVGLAGSALGPLFPDQSELHHAGLRRAALALARARGVPLGEAIGACVAGPALDTPAERRYWARAGADVAVQDLATPLHAAAHAGLALLALVAVTDRGEGTSDLAGIVQRANTLAPALEDLLLALVPELATLAQSLGADA